MSKLTDIVTELALPDVVQNGCTLWDVEYVKEAGDWYLRLYIDKEGGVNIQDCEAISRAVSDKLDEADPIEGSYTFEVSSAGADRILKKPEHFAAFLGSEVDVKLYRAVNGQKLLQGTLQDYKDDAITILLHEEPLTLEKKDVAQVRLHVTF